MATRKEPAFFQTASTHLQAILRNEHTLSRWIQKANFQRDNIAYRAIDANNGYVLDVGLFSRFPGDKNNRWPRELLVHHLTNGKVPNSSPSRRTLRSPYLSISTDPSKILSFMGSRSDQKEVVVLDMDMLNIMEVDYRRTTDLEREYNFKDHKDGKTWAAYSHFLVFEHIPQCCILGFVSGTNFVNIWETRLAEIETDVSHRGPKKLDWHRDLEGSPYLRDQSNFARTPQFESLLATPPASNGRMHRTVRMLERTRLNPSTPGTPSKRARPSSPEMISLMDEDEGRDTSRRRLSYGKANDYLTRPSTQP